MTYDIPQAINILSRTPEVLEQLLAALPADWLHSNEGEQTWSPYEVVGHLIHGEKTDWIPRAQLILSDAADKTFVPFDRFAQAQNDPNRPIEDLLLEFKTLRGENLSTLREMNIHTEQLEETGIHPDLGEARLKELLATWVVHDLGHIAQISRVMARQYQTEVGPWTAYLSILKRE